MKKTRFSEEQMVKILREADKAPVSEVAKKHGVSEVTIYAWRKRFGQLEAVDVKRLRALEGENARLKKVLAERVMDIEILKEVAAKKGERVRAPATDRLRMPTGTIGTASVRAVERGEIDRRLPVAVGVAGRARGRRDARARRTVPPIWLSAHPSLLGASRSQHEHRQSSSTLEASQDASA